MKKTLALLAVLLALPALGADTVIQSDKLKIGKPATSADKVIEFNTGDGSANSVIKKNKTTGKIQFSNDGSLFKDIGSGGGGGSGINLLADNPGLEAGVTQNMSASAPSTVTAITGSNALFETTSFQFLPTISGQTYETQAYAVQKGLQGGPCLAAVYYTSAESSNLINGAVYSGSNTLLSQQIPFTRNVGAAAPLYIPFTCPTSGSVKIRMTSTGSVIAGLIGDNMHLGSETRLREVSQASMFGSALWTSASGCTWADTSTDTFTQYAAVAACNNPTVTGAALVPATKIPQLRFAGLPAGEYIVHAVGSFQCSAGGIPCAYAISDGTTTKKAGVQYAGSGANWQKNIVARFSHSSDQPATGFDIRSTGSTGSATSAVQVNDTSDTLEMWVERLPSSSQTITGSSGQAAIYRAYQDVPVSQTASGSYVDFNPLGSPATLTQIENVNFGAVVSEASGLPGLSISFPHPGVRYKICARLNAGSPTANALGAFRLYDGTVEIGSDAQTFTTANASYPVLVCGVYNPSSVAPKTITLQVKAGGSMGLDAATGHEVTWEIFQLDAGQAAVAFPTLVTSPIQQKLKVVAYTYSSTQIGMNQVAHPSAGVWDNDISAGAFTVPPVCTASVSDVGGTVGVAVMGAVTTTAAQVRTFFGGSLSDVAYHVQCIGY